MSVAEAFRQWITSDQVWADHNTPINNYPMLSSKRGAMIHHLEELCGGEPERRSFLKYVFGVDSSADLTCRQQNALYLWLDPQKANDDPADKRWIVSNPKAPATVAAVLDTVRRAAGQLDFSFAEQAQREAEERGQLYHPQRPA